MDEYMKSIDLALTDEKKSVTAKWLNMRLNVADSSSVLAAYLKRAHSGKKKVHATYVLTGVESSCPHKIVTAFSNDTQLEDTRKRFERVLSETLYSVQRFEVEDFSKLFLADFDLLREHVIASHAKRAAKRVTTKSEPEAPTEKEAEKTAVKSSNGEGNSAATSDGVVHYRKGSLMGMLSKKTESGTTSHPEEQSSTAKPSADSRPKSKPTKTTKTTKTAATRSKAAEQKAKPAQTSANTNGFTKQVGKRVRVFEDDSSCDDSSDSEPEEPLPKRRATAVVESVNRKTDQETSEPCTKPKHPEPPITFDSDSDSDHGARSTDEEPLRASNSASKKNLQKDASSKLPKSETTSLKESNVHQNADSEERAATMTRRVPVQRTYLGSDGFLVTETVYQTETVAVDRTEETPHDASAKKNASESDSRSAAQGASNAKRTDDAKNNNPEKTGVAQGGKKHQTDVETDRPASSRGRPAKKQVEVGPKQAQLTSWFKKV